MTQTTKTEVRTFATYVVIREGDSEFSLMKLIGESDAECLRRNARDYQERLASYQRAVDRIERALATLEAVR